jgi:hypothetical protein
MVFGIGVRGGFPVRAFFRLIATIAARTQVHARGDQRDNRRYAGRDSFAFA